MLGECMMMPRMVARSIISNGRAAIDRERGALNAARFL